MLDTTRKAADYEVLSPWAEADAVPARGIMPRLDTLDGRKVGLFANGKRAAVPSLTALERELKARFPKVDISWYRCTVFNTPEVLTEGKAKFEEWARQQDAVALSVGD
jgi:hypothetical protein